MDSMVSARFFRVSDPTPQQKDVPDLLDDIMSQSPTGNREQDLGNGVNLRLERCDKDGDYLTGEFCRKQTDNLPPQAGDEGLAPILLDDGQGLGHVAAFIYHVPTRVILLQNNRQCASPNTVSLYLARRDRRKLFALTPVLRKDSLERLRKNNIRRFTVRFASPANLSILDSENMSAAENARLLADAYEGPEVEITVSVGRRRGTFLNKMKVLNTLLGLRNSSADVTKLEAQTHDGLTSDPIDIIKDHLKGNRSLDLPFDNPDNNFQYRLEYLKELFDSHLDYLKDAYRDAPDGNAS